MPDFEALAQKQGELIRKALDGSAFIADIAATPYTEMTGPDSQLIAFPEDSYEDLGWLSSDGMQYGRDISTSEVSSFGSVSATRSDTNADTTTVTVVAQETKLLTIGLATGADLRNLTPAPGGGVKIAKPVRPRARFYRYFGIMVDDSDLGEVYVGRELPRVKPTSFAEQNYSGGDDPLTWGVTLTAYKDSELGYAEAYHFGGPGWLAMLEQMGFKPAATP